MEACCLACGDHYLNEDGSTDPAALTKAQARFIVWARETGYAETWVARNMPDIGKCTCECHVKGTSIMH
jgi:hypothetical protein